MGRFEERGFDSVVCPKPRRLGLFNSSAHDFAPTFRWPSNCYQTELADSKAGTELDIILTKGGYGADIPSIQVASSPPFFSGSPPSRASNPLIQDAQFNNRQQVALQSSPAAPPPSPSPSSRVAGGGGGCVRMKFGQKPAVVRIEGFDCRRSSRDGRNCSISAVA